MDTIQIAHPAPKVAQKGGFKQINSAPLSKKLIFQYKIFSSIIDIPQDQWLSVWPNPGESYNFYLCQEKANLTEFQFFYLVVYCDDKVVLIAPLFTADFNLGIVLEGVGERLIVNIQKFWPRFLMMRTLFCGSPVSTNGVIGIDPGYVHNSELMTLFERALHDFAIKCQVRMIVLKDFLGGDLRVLKPLRSMGYFEADSYPMAVLKIDFSSMEDYFSKLSHQTRKDLRRKIRKTEALGGVDIEVVNTIDDCAEEICRLYQNVYNKSVFHFEHLTKDFFNNFCRYMPTETRFFLYRANNKLIGFNFCLVQEDALVDKYLGFDYTASREYNLYFMSYLNNVKWCLENGKKNYFLSQGGYETKSRLGAGVIPLRGMIKIIHPFFTPFIRLMGWVCGRKTNG